MPEPHITLAMDWLDFQYVLTAWSMLVNAWLTYDYDMVSTWKVYG
jgi:hypothetical protein